MCIIIVKKAGVAMPDADTLEQCFYMNPDGAGFMYYRAGKVHIKKGYMDLKSLEKALEKHKLGKEDDVVIHFRITTSGGTKKQNCHPFPLSSSAKELRSVDITCEAALAHNGIIGQGCSDLSDTMLFIRDIASHETFINGVFLDKRDIRKFIAYYTEGSRLVYMYATPKGAALRFYGDWIDDEKTGLMFSNYGYQIFDERFSWPDIGSLPD